MKTIKFKIFDLLKANNEDPYASRVIFSSGLEEINSNIMNDAIEFDCELMNLSKA